MIFYGSGASSKEWTIQYHLESIYGGTVVPRYGVFVLNDEDETTRQATKASIETVESLDSTVLTHLDLYKKDFPNPAQNHRGCEDKDQYYERLSLVRNFIIEKFLETSMEYLFLCDADVEISENCLERLVEGVKNSKDQVRCAVVRNGPTGVYNYLHWNADERCYWRPNVVDRGPVPGLSQVALSGACMVLPRAVLERDGMKPGARFGVGKHGEDAVFCERIYDRGYKIMVDPIPTTKHHKDNGKEPLYSHDENDF